MVFKSGGLILSVLGISLMNGRDLPRFTMTINGWECFIRGCLFADVNMYVHCVSATIVTTPFGVARGGVVVTAKYGKFTFFVFLAG